MELSELGFDNWFRQRYEELNRPDCHPARVIRVDRGRFLVTNGQTDIYAELLGKFLFSAESRQDVPCVGDWITIDYHDDGKLAIIRDLMPRKTFLRRKTAGKRIDFQMLAANVEYAFIVQSCDTDFNLRRLERYLVMIKDGGVEPVILLSKSDLVTAVSLEKMIADIRAANITATVIAFSNTTGSGMDSFQQVLEQSKTYCLIGSSGVGKTTLINKLIGHAQYATNSVRKSDGKGKHTTAARQLVVLKNGALLIDTPGLRELGLMTSGYGLADSFIDINELAAKCRFRDCTHTRETGCAIREAIVNGELTEDRYRSYLKLKKESDFHEMSYLEKRRKDREFGRMIKSILKSRKDR